ncbi:GNAT family N-acetyltransferase [Priestia koreensis]|uniref:GNAT family N-acetyltransferase n=1 Tax=Priestia koreensis TaxID=284581 RepID=UPI003457414E
MEGFAAYFMISQASVLQLIECNEIHIKPLVQLSSSIDWDYSREDLETIMSTGRIFAHQTEQGEIVSSGALVTYGGKMTCIGMVIVHPNYQGVGLGTEIMRHCLSLLGNQSAMLIATEEGKPMYEKLGFLTVSAVRKYFCVAPVRNSKHDFIKPYDSLDLSSVLRLDAEAFGDERQSFLRKRIEQATKRRVLRKSEEICGFGLAVETSQNLILGPIVAPTAEDAVALVRDLVQGYRGKLRIDVPTEQKSFQQLLEQSGFVFVNEPPIMIYGVNSLDKRNGDLYSIAAQIFG